MKLDRDEVAAVARAIAAEHNSDPDGWQEVAANVVAGVDALFRHRQIKMAAAVSEVKAMQDEAADVARVAAAIDKPVDGPLAANVERIRPNPNRAKKAKGEA